MKYRNFPNTDLNVSEMALGTWVFGADMWGGADEGDCQDCVRFAIDHGVTMIDTAPIYGYGQSESIVGKAIRGMRDRVVIATKCGLVGKGKKISSNLSTSTTRFW